jgi:DnaK suppressor protein
MSRASIEGYRQVLEAKQIELAGSHRNVDGIAVERAADSMDEIILANERDLALRALTREAFICRCVSAALERLVAGTFGYCLLCDEPISERRLHALPWAALCLRCQEATDNAHGTQTASPGWLLSDAA